MCCVVRKPRASPAACGTYSRGRAGSIASPEKSCEMCDGATGSAAQNHILSSCEVEPGACMQVVCVMLSAVQGTCAPAGQQSPPAQAQSASAGPVSREKKEQLLTVHLLGCACVKNVQGSRLRSRTAWQRGRAAAWTPSTPPCSPSATAPLSQVRPSTHRLEKRELEQGTVPFHQAVCVRGRAAAGSDLPWDGT